MKRKILLFSLLNLFVFAFSQNREVFVGKEVQAVTSKGQTDLLNEMFYDYKVFKINSSELTKYVENKALSLFTLELGKSQTFNIDLEPSAVLSADYERIVNGVSTKGIHQTPKNIAYRGKSEKDDIAMTITKGFITAYIKGKNQSFYIEPLRNITGTAGEDLYIFYSEKDVKPTDYKCGLTETQKQITALGEHNFTEASTDQKGCVTVRLAVAAAYDMVEFYGSIADVENKIIALINGVNVDYATVFNKTIKFDIVATNISDGASSSLDTALGTSDIGGTVLDSFTNWSKAGNLSDSKYDLGLLYLKRQMQNGVVGLAWVGAFCSNGNYAIVRDYRNNLSLIRNVTSHEIGHTFGCGHTTGIMAAVSSESSEWDQTSINTINNKEVSTSCNQGNTALQGSANASFSLVTTACKNEIIALNANMSRNATVFDWSALGSTTENPSGQKTTTSYTTAGEKTISLDISNSFTCDGNIATSTTSRNIQVLDMEQPTAGNCNYQASNTATGGLYYLSPTKVVFGSINRSSSDAFYDKLVYDNVVCSNYTIVEEGSNNVISITRAEANYPVGIKVWIDYNNDGVFNNAEMVVNVNGIGAQTYRGEIAIPKSVSVKNTMLRMRIVTDYASVTGACSTRHGQIEDYGVIIVETASTTETKTASEIVLANNPIENSAEFILPKNISDKKIKIHAYDMSGKWIATQTLQNNNGRAIIPTSAWEKGAYLFVIEFDGKMQKSIKALK